MSQEEVYKQFTTKFPQFAEHIQEWFPNGRNSVRVRMKTGSDFIFTYHNWNDWCFETVESFIKKLKGDKKMC